MPSGLDIDALELAKLASDASTRASVDQELAVRDLRLHAGTLLAAASLVVTFLGGQAIELNGFGALAWLAIAAFVVSLVAALDVLKPASGSSAGIDARWIYAHLELAAVDLADAHRLYAFAIDELRQANEAIVRRRRSGYGLASWSLLAQTAAWLAHLAS